MVNNSLFAVAIDCADAAALARFWADVLGRQIAEGCTAERAVLLAGGGIIHAHDLPLPAAVRTAADDAPLSLQEVERRHIAAVLQRTNWHQGKAAGLLGISAKTLYRKIREYGFERPAGVETP